MLSASYAASSNVSAVPDYGKDDCVSFKEGSSVNPLNFTFGYACVSKASCEVSRYGCMDETCHFPEYSRGTRTTLSSIPTTTLISSINMAPMGISLDKHNDRWCLVQDGSGRFWALDKLRGTQENFNLNNQDETIVSCKLSDSFSSTQGCVTTSPVY